MDTKPRSALLSANYQVPTRTNMSKWLVLSEWEEQSNNNVHMSNIELSQLYDSAVAGLNSTEARLKNMNQKSCSSIPGSGTEDFDTDAMLTCDGSSSDDEEITLELERSLLEDDPDIIDEERNNYSCSAAKIPPSLMFSNLDTNNNFSCTNQSLNGSENQTFCLEDKEKSDDHIQVQFEHRMSGGITPKRIVFWEGQETNCKPSSKETLDVNPYSTKINCNGYSNSIPINAKLNSNILGTNRESSVDKDFFRDSTVENVSDEVGWSEFLKSNPKSMHFSHTLCSELSEIYKDCNENIFAADSDGEILSLEPTNVNESLEPPEDSLKSDLSGSPFKKDSNVRSIWDRLSDLTSLEVSPNQDGSSSISQVGSIDQNELKKDSPFCLMPEISQVFSPVQDFGKRTKFIKKCEVIPDISIVKKSFDEDIIRISPNEAVPLPRQNHVATSVKSLPKDKEKGLKRKLQFEIDSEYEKRDSQCELKDQSKTNGTNISMTVERSCEHSGDSQTTKSDLMCIKKDSTELTFIKNDSSLTYGSNIQIPDPGNLFENLDFELLPLPCKGSVPDNLLTDCQTKIIPKVEKLFKFEGKTPTIPLERSCKHSGDSPPTKSYLTGHNENSIERTNMKNDGKSLPNNSNIQKVNPVSLRENSNLGLSPLPSTADSQSSDDRTKIRTKIIQNMHTSVKKTLKSLFEVRNSNVDNHFRNPKYEELKKSSESSGTKDKEGSAIVISVNNNISNQRRSVTMRNNLEKRANSSITQQNGRVSVKSNLNVGNQSVSDKNKLGQDSENFVANRQLVDDRTPGKKFGSEWGNIPRNCSGQFSNGPQGVKKHKKSKTSKKRAKILNSMSKSGNLTPQNLSGTVNIQLVPINGKTQTCGATSSSNISVATLHSSSHSKNLAPHSLSQSRNIPETASSSSSKSRNIPVTASTSSARQEPTRPQNNVNATAKDSLNGRKFVKAKRVLVKQKELSTLLEGEDCFDESKINDRVQWVCRRWKVDTLSNQDINLTTAAYTRSHLSTQRATFFRGCLEGQKDYTLAIIAPNRKRQLNQDDYSTASYDTRHAGKRRRLSQDVQVIPDDSESSQPELFSRQLMDKLASNQNVSLQALIKQRNDELNVLNEQFYFRQCQLLEKQFQEQQYHNYYGYGYHTIYKSMYELKYNHDCQQKQLDLDMQRRYDDVKRNYVVEERRVRAQYKTNLEKVKTVVSEGSSDSDCMTVALRKAPSRMNNYKTTYQSVSLTPHVALAMVREDEIYDSFYSHKV